MKYLLTCLALTLLAPFQFKPNKTSLSAVIYDEYGMPLPGTTVIEVGTVNGVSTDFDGNYTIEVLKSSRI